MAWTVHLLGPVEASLDGRRVALGTTKQRAVLAMLALQVNRTVSVDRLAEGLWGERPPDSAAKMLQLYVSQLRKLLGGGDGAEILTHGRGYELRLVPEAVDAERFESLVAGAAQADGNGGAREALGLWRGDALADVADEPFAAAEIRRLGELRLRANELAVDGDLAAGRHAGLIGELEALVAAHPLQERLHAQRMLALYRSGRQAEALDAYREARTVLVGEIGVEPGHELRALQDAVLRQDPALDLPSAEPPSARDDATSTPDAPAPPARPASRRARVRRALAAAAGLALAGGLAAIVMGALTDAERLPRIEGNAVGLIDTDDGRITAQFAVGRDPSALAAGGGSVWVASGRDATVSRLDRERNEIVTIPVGDDPAGLAFAAGSLWVANREGRTVSQIDPRRNTVVQSVEVGNAPRAVAAGFGGLWVASEVDRKVARVDPARAAKVAEIDVGANPTAVATGAGAVWVTSEEAGSVFRIEPGSGAVVKTIRVGNGPVGVAVGGDAVWVANRQDATVSRIDPATDAVTETVGVGSDPSAIAAGEGGVWVANRGDGTVSRIDPATRRVVDTVEVSNSPSALVVAAGLGLGGAGRVAGQPPGRHPARRDAQGELRDRARAGGL